MYALYDATIDCDADTRELYRRARGVRYDATGRPVNEPDIVFPLEHCTIMHSGSAIVISFPIPVPRGQTGGPDFRLDRLEDAPEPSETMKGARPVWTITGISERKANAGIALEHQQVAFTVVRASGSHTSGNALELLA